MDRYFIKIKADVFRGDTVNTGFTELVLEDDKPETLQNAVGGDIEKISLEVFGDILGDFMLIVNKDIELKNHSLNTPASVILDINNSYLDKHGLSQTQKIVDPIFGDVVLAWEFGDEPIGLDPYYINRVIRYIRQYLTYTSKIKYVGDEEQGTEV